MRSISCLCLVAVVAVGLAASAGRADLVSYWAMDEGAGSTVGNAVAGGPVGTLHNMDNADWVTGHNGSGTALQFDGSNDYASFPTNATLDAVNANLTTSAWVKTNWTGGTWFRTTFAKFGLSGGQTPFWGLGWMSADDLGFVVRDSTGANYKLAAPNAWGQDGQWHMLTGVRDQAVGQVLLYADGQMIARANDTIGDISNTREMSIARHGGGSYVPETVDDVAVWNQPISPYGIDQLAKGQVTVPAAATASNALLDDNPSFSWRFEETGIVSSGAAENTPLVDSSGNGLNSGTTAWGVSLGNSRPLLYDPQNRYAQFDGSNDIAALEYLPQTALGTGTTDSYTIETWFNADTKHQGDIVAITNSGGNKGHGILLEVESDGKIRYLHRSPSGSGGGSNIQTGQYVPGMWHHLAAVKDASSNEMRLFLDGNLLGVAPDSTTIDYDMQMVVSRLGRSSQGRWFDGGVDELTIYPAALTQDQIRTHIEAAVGPAAAKPATLVSHWTMDADDVIGTALVDVAGSNHGSIRGGPTVVPGRLGQALQFDGQNDYVEVSHTPTLDLNEQMAVSAWINTDWQDGSWFRTLVAKYGYSGTNESWGLGWMADDQLGFYIRDGESPRHDASARADQWEGLDGQWHHVIGIRDNGVVRFYIDGVLVGDGAAATLDDVGDMRNTRPVTFARHYGDEVPVTMDDISIWSGGLSQYEVAQLARGVAPEDIQQGPSYRQAVLDHRPVAYWRMEETTGDIRDELGAHPATPHEGNRRWSGMAITERANNSAQLDGSNDWIEVNNSFDGSSGQFADYTVEMWYKPTGMRQSDLFAAVTDYAGSGDNHVILLETQTNGTIRLLHRVPAGTGGGTSLFAGSYLEDEWNHIVGVKDGDTLLLYLNGVLAGELTGSLNAIDFDFDVVLGRIDSERNIRNANGWMDEVAFYDYALSAGTIFGHYELSFVPEPVTMASVFLAAAGLGGYLRRRRRG